MLLVLLSFYILSITFLPTAVTESVKFFISVPRILNPEPDILSYNERFLLTVSANVYIKKYGRERA